MSAALRAHMRELHPHVRLPRSNADLERAHAEHHHRVRPRNHYHAGPNPGPGDRPPGWKSGGDVVRTDTDRIAAADRAAVLIRALNDK